MTMMMEEEVGKCPTVTVPASGPEAPHASVKAKHGGEGGTGDIISILSVSLFPTPPNRYSMAGGWVDG